MSPEVQRHTWRKAAERAEAGVRDARCCDALDPCEACRARTELARSYRRLVRSVTT